MKILLFIFCAIAMLSLYSCSQSMIDDNTNTPIITNNLIKGNWDLTEYRYSGNKKWINIHDQYSPIAHFKISFDFNNKIQSAKIIYDSMPSYDYLYTINKNIITINYKEGEELALTLKIDQIQSDQFVAGNYDTYYDLKFKRIK